MTEKSSAVAQLSIPRRAILEGNVSFPGHVVVDGTIVGDVRCSSILITERGTVDGVIYAKSAIVMGEASGTIYANQITLKTACSVTADIYHGQLSLENGCYFEGRSRREANPLSLPDMDASHGQASDGLAR